MISKIKCRPWLVDTIILTLFLTAFYLIQTRAIGRIVYVATDEGVYLYSAKLISQGLLIYRDFFLGHLPFLMYANALVLYLVKFDLNIYHFLYTLWTVSTIIPVYFTVKKLTTNRFAAFLSIVILATFVELVQWDMHFFAIRQASLPFLAWAIFFLSGKKNLALTALFLGLFAICLQTNAILALILILCYLFCAFVFNRQELKFKEFLWPTAIFIGLILSQITFLALVKNGLSDAVLFQVNRYAVDLVTRKDMLLEFLKLNWPIFTYGLAGTFVFKKETAYLSIFNLLSIPIIILAGNSYFNHYLVIMAVTLAITSGILFGAIFKFSKALYLPVAFFVLVSVFSAGFDQLNFSLIKDRNTGFFETVEILKTTKDPLMSNEPIYALYANKNLTFHYDVADMRHLAPLGESFPEEKYMNIAKESQTVLVEPFLASELPQSVKDYILENFRSIYDNGTESVWVRK